MKFVAKAQESRERDANMMMRGFVKIQTAKVLCLRLQCLERIRTDVLKFTTGTEGQVNKMSDDLISRKALLEEIAISFVIPILKINLRPEHKTVFRIEEIIENTPIAFDKEKVIEDLTDWKNDSEKWAAKYDEAGDTDNMDLQDMAVRCYVNAIKIVKKGGIK